MFPKRIFALCVLICVGSPLAMTSSCLEDVVQMSNQIVKYKSITTTDCKKNYQGFGVVEVTGESESGGKCNATCHHATGEILGAVLTTSSVACSWTLGDWVNTLSC